MAAFPSVSMRFARKHREPLALVFLLTAAWGLAAAAQAVLAVELVETTVVEERWTERGQFDYGVPVASGPGAPVLGMGEPAYFVSQSPTFDARFRWRVDAAQPVEVEAQARLVALVTGEGWRLEEPLGEATLLGRAGDELQMSGTVDVALLAQRADGLAEGPRGQSEWAIVAVVSAAIDGAAPDEARFSMPMRHLGAHYVLPKEAVTVERAETETSVVHHPRRAGLHGLAEAPAGALAFAAGGLALAALRRPGAEASA